MSMPATVVSGSGHVLPLAAVAVGLLMLAVWGVSLAMRDVSVVDVAWGPAFVVVALVAAVTGGGDSGRRWLLLALAAVWGLRLGAHIALRKVAQPGEDRRYAGLRVHHPGGFALYSLVAIFAGQALLVLIVSLPLQIASGRSAALSWAVVPGLVVYVVGMVFEAVGDDQLRRFRGDEKNVGKVMDRGLWRYTRHPNYFGDACVWWGLWLVALPAGGTWWTAVGPAVMTVLLVGVSGKALLERYIADRRPGYAAYVRRTSGFLPRRPRG